MINDAMRALADRWIRTADDIDERKKDLKEIELEAKAKGVNVAKMKAWCQAERKNKLDQRKADAADDVLIGEALGHDVGFGSVPRSGNASDQPSLEMLKLSAALGASIGLSKTLEVIAETEDAA